MNDFPLDLYNYLTRTIADHPKGYLREPPSSKGGSQDDWKEAAKPIHGHMCDGLHIFQYTATGCMPSFSRYSDEGMIITGCDDYHKIPFVYCPFCGTRVDSDD